MKKVDSKKRVSAKDADRKGGKGMEYPAPKLPPLPTFKKVSTGAAKDTQKNPPRAVKPKEKASRAKKKSSAKRRVASAKKATRGTKRTPATRYSQSVTATEQPPDLAMQVSELQGQIAALKALVEHTQASPSPVSAFQSQPSSSSLATRHSPLATAAQQPQPPATAGPPLPVYELKETRPVGYHSRDILDSSSEESQDGFYTSLLDRARIQWLMGDWEGLSKLDLEQIRAHPERAKLALFGAVGRFYTSQADEAKKYVAYAKSHGCPPNLFKSIILSGIHQSMYSAHFLCGRANRGKRHQSELDRIGLLKAKTTGRSFYPTSAQQSLPGQQEFLAEIPPRIRLLAKQTAEDENSTEKSARLLRTEDFSPREKFLFLCQLSKEFQKKGNNMVASSYLDEASRTAPHGEERGCMWRIVKGFLDLGMPEEAFVKRIAIPELDPVLTQSDSEALHKAGKDLLEKIFDTKGHGHELLISAMRNFAGRLRTECAGRKTVVIEIGTTRESASGQGSTRRLADFCQKENFHFITVDMDSACTEMAKQMFQHNNYPFEAIHSKGEDFLAGYHGPIDCIFLDAYDFDHGKHTELRQSRYEKFLGSRILETDCHRMHLECAKQVVAKAQPWTLVCLDDTWLHFGRWTAKGTLAVPFLIEQGYNFLDIRNKAALLGGDYWLGQVSAEKPY